MEPEVREGEGPGDQKRKGRLAKETSAYLRHHASNPVDWYPWGEEAFRRASETDRPIFLSIGYSSCHWCHVMERESFEDGEVAKILNEKFVPIKVDREERPDIDSIYMNAANLLIGNAGWPLTIVMTPDKRPFFAATYLPRDGKGGIPGLIDLLPTMAEFWKQRRKELESSADRILKAMSLVPTKAGGFGVGEDALHRSFMTHMTIFDETYAGFGIAPKFPSPHRSMFLLRYWNRTGEGKALWMVDRTLKAMRSGGIYDQLEGGFHRYSMGQDWSLPHFGKMYIDQSVDRPSLVPRPTWPRAISHMRALQQRYWIMFLIE